MFHFDMKSASTEDLPRPAHVMGGSVRITKLLQWLRITCQSHTFWQRSGVPSIPRALPRSLSPTPFRKARSSRALHSPITPERLLQAQVYRNSRTLPLQGSKVTQRGIRFSSSRRCLYSRPPATTQQMVPSMFQQVRLLCRRIQVPSDDPRTRPLLSST